MPRFELLDHLSTTLAGPPGQFHWRAQWRRVLGPLRGIDAEPIALDQQLRLQLVPWPKLAPTGSRARTVAAGVLKALGSEFGLAPATSAAEFQVWLHGATCLPEHWRRLFALCAARTWLGGYSGYALDWALATAAGGLGVPAAVALYFETLAATPGLNDRTLHWEGDGSGLGVLRCLLAGVSEPVYAACRDAARPYAGHPNLVLALASAFATESAWLELALLATAELKDAAALLLDCQWTADQARRLYGLPGRWSGLDSEQLERAMLNPVRLFGSSGAPELLQLLLCHQASADARQQVCTVLRACDSAAALAVLLQEVDLREARLQLDDFATAHPTLALVLATRQLQHARSKALEDWLMRFAARCLEALPAARAELGAGPAALLDRIIARFVVSGPEATAAQLPPVLARPPWLQPRAAPPRNLAPLPELPAIDQLAWPDGLQQRWARIALGQPGKSRRGERVEAVLAELGLHDRHAELLAGSHRPAPADYAPRSCYGTCIDLLAYLPPGAARVVWETFPVGKWYEYGGHLEGLLHRHGLVFLDGLLRYLDARLQRGLELALPFRSSRIAPFAARALRQAIKARPAAQAWLLAHAAVAVRGLLPLAGPGAAKAVERADAEAALRWLASHGRQAELEAGSAAFGPAGVQRLQAVLQFDPLQLLPPRLPRLPAFFVPAQLLRPRLADGTPLAVATVEVLGTMLAFATLDQPYAGLAQVRAACDRNAQADFAWDLFQAWLQAGAPARESWAFTALGHLGNDSTARRLAPLIRAWPGASAHARAVLGLDVLAAIGSDLALMLLDGIARKVQFKALQERAAAKIAQVAEIRGLTPEELADRLVPDLGLDAQGSLQLDFGPRQFSLGFDQALQPRLRDGTGKWLKELPKPVKSDDPDAARGAAARWKALKQEARAVASQQIQRMELAMIERRRWSAAQFRQLWVEHPLLRHLVQRVLWASYPEAGPPRPFRVAEDLSYADAADALLPETALDAPIGIVHPLELDAAAAAAFGQVFADYEILQPFRQLGREVYRLDETEQQALEITRQVGRQVATGSLLGLQQRGWRRGDPGDGGHIGEMLRAVADDLVLVLELDPGMCAGVLELAPQQILQALRLIRGSSWNPLQRCRFAELDPIIASEALRDLDLLAAVP